MKTICRLPTHLLQTGMYIRMDCASTSNIQTVTKMRKDPCNSSNPLCLMYLQNYTYILGVEDGIKPHSAETWLKYSIWIYKKVSSLLASLHKFITRLY